MKQYTYFVSGITFLLKRVHSTAICSIDPLITQLHSSSTHYFYLSTDIVTLY